MLKVELLYIICSQVLLRIFVVEVCMHPYFFNFQLLYCVCELWYICCCLGALRLQLVLNSLDENAKEDFQNGTNGAVVSILIRILIRILYH